MGCNTSVPEERTCDMCGKRFKKNQELFYNYTFQDKEYKMCVMCLAGSTQDHLTNLNG